MCTTLGERCIRLVKTVLVMLATICGCLLLSDGMAKFFCAVMTLLGVPLSLILTKLVIFVMLGVPSLFMTNVLCNLQGILEGYAKTVTLGGHIQRYSRVLDVGGGLDSRILKYYPYASNSVNLELKYGWDVEKKGLPDGPWDLIFVNHLIEHLHDVDLFLNFCKGAMGPKTILEIGTPNLSAWFNRIFFLFGYLPHSYEVSREFNVGKPLNWNKEELGGHIHVFTPKALCQLLTHHGFKIHEVLPESSTYTCPRFILAIDKLLSLNVNLASAFRVRCSYQS